jgi:hypothetical protein
MARRAGLIADVGERRRGGEAEVGGLDHGGEGYSDQHESLERQLNRELSGRDLPQQLEALSDALEQIFLQGNDKVPMQAPVEIGVFVFVRECYSLSKPRRVHDLLHGIVPKPGRPQRMMMLCLVVGCAGDEAQYAKESHDRELVSLIASVNQV